MKLWIEVLIYVAVVSQCVLGIFRIRYDDLSWWIVFIPLELFTLIMCIHKLYTCNKKNEENDTKRDTLLSIEV